MHVRWNYISWLMRSEVKRDGVASPTALSPERQRGQVVMPPAKAGHMTAGENGNIGLADYDRSGLAQPCDGARVLRWDIVSERGSACGRGQRQLIKLRNENHSEWIGRLATRDQGWQGRKAPEQLHGYNGGNNGYLSGSLAACANARWKRNLSLPNALFIPG
jgi:hypothetical protein